MKMIKTSISLQELRRRIYFKSKEEKSHRFWGLYVHVCKYETLEEAYTAYEQKVNEKYTEYKETLPN